MTPSSCLPHPTTKKISVVSDFNGWDPTATPLHPADTACTATIILPEGKRFAFRYRRDNGEFFNDEAAHDYQPNTFGGYDCVIDLTGDPP